MWFAQTAEPTLYDSTVVVTSTSNAGVGAMFWVLWLLYMVVVVLAIVAMWKIFVKAGEAGWKSLIPFYNTYIMFKLAGRNGWGFLLMFIPLVNIVVWFVVCIDFAKHFGKDTLFGVVGLFFFSIIGYLILGFGEAEYVGPKHA
jgi:hypothetical protein